MSIQIYTKSKIVDFNNNLDTRKLHREIISSTNIAKILNGINVENDIVQIVFENILSHTEELALNNIISSHSPDPIAFNGVDFITITADDSPYRFNKNSLLCDTNDGNIIINLPIAHRVKKGYAIIKKLGNDNIVTVKPHEQNLIDNLVEKVLSSDDEYTVLYSDGDNWLSVSGNTVIDRVQNNLNLTVTNNKGDLIVDTGEEPVNFPIGNNNQFLCSDSQSNYGVEWKYISHHNIINLDSDDHPQYTLLSGRSGGQIITGGINANDDLILRSTSDDQKGNVIVDDPLLVNIIDANDIESLFIGNLNANKVNISRSEIITDIKGSLTVQQGITVIGSVVVSGLVDGRDINLDGIKLDSHVIATSNIHGVTGNVVGTSDQQTLSNKIFIGDTTYFADNIDISKRIKLNLNNIAPSTTRTITIPDSNITIVGVSTQQNLVNKTIDANLNTIINIDNDDIKANAQINTTKLADGSVSNTSFQYINSLSSNAQTQLNSRVVGPNSSVINSIPRFDNVNGKIIKGTNILVDDDNNISGVKSLDIYSDSNDNHDHLVILKNDKLDGDFIICKNSANSNIFEVGKNGGGDGNIKLANSNGAISFVNDSGYCKIGPTLTGITETYLLTLDGGDSDNGLLINTGSSNDNYGIKVGTNLSESFSVQTSTKSIGIGTWNPTYGLDNRNTTGNAADINTQNGVYRVSGEKLSMNHLNDVIISSPENGHHLKYNGSHWVNSSIEGIAWKGIWENKNYSVDEAVSYNGSSYICRNATASNQPPTNNDFWELMASKGDQGEIGPIGPSSILWKGIWDNNIKYLINDSVEHNGTSFVCVQDCLGIEPDLDQNLYWDILAKKGETGILGDWQGTWTNKNYIVNQSVFYNGSSYICKLNTTSNQLPTNTIYWDLIASKGSDGSGTSIYFSYNGVNIDNTPHGELNFVGHNVDIMDDGSGNASITIGPKCFYAYNTTNLTQFSFYWVDITWEFEGRKDPYYSHDHNSNEITINKSGWYDVHFDLCIESVGSGSRTGLEFRTLEDTGSGYTEIPGTRVNFYCRQSGYGTSGSIKFLREFSVGSKIKAQGIIINGYGTIKTISNGTRVIIKTI